MTSALLSDFPDEDAAREPWFVEAKDRDPAPESARQRAFLGRLKVEAPAVIAIAVPNAGKRSDWERLERWREGAVAGALDLVLLWRGGTFIPEFKSGKGDASPAQREMLNRLHRAGIHCGVYRTADTLLAHLRAAGAPFISREGRL